MGKFVDKKYCKKCGVKLLYAHGTATSGSWHYNHNICIFCTNKARLEGRSDMRNG